MCKIVARVNVGLKTMLLRSMNGSKSGSKTKKIWSSKSRRFVHSRPNSKSIMRSTSKSNPGPKNLNSMQWRQNRGQQSNMNGANPIAWHMLIPLVQDILNHEPNWMKIIFQINEYLSHNLNWMKKILQIIKNRFKRLKTCLIQHPSSKNMMH